MFCDKFLRRQTLVRLLTAPNNTRPIPDSSCRLGSCFWCAELFSSWVAAFALNPWCLGFNWISKLYVNTDFEANSSQASTGVHNSFG